LSTNKREEIEKLQEKQIKLNRRGLLEPKFDEPSKPTPILEPDRTDGSEGFEESNQSTTPGQIQKRIETNSTSDTESPGMAATIKNELESEASTGEQETIIIKPESDNDLSNSAETEPAEQTQAVDKSTTSPEAISSETAHEADATNAISGLGKNVLGYTVQVVSIQNMEAADKMVRELTEMGYAAYAVRTVLDGKTWYRLRIGFFKTRAEARRILDELRAHHYTPILIQL
jgi:septal ring-binding cell division protein DamX